MTGNRATVTKGRDILLGIRNTGKCKGGRIREMKTLFVKERERRAVPQE